MTRQGARHRVAVLAHGHPELSSGGAEIAAQALHQAFEAREDMRSLHVCCVPFGHPLGGTERAGTFFQEEGCIDPFHLTTRDPEHHRDLLERLRELDPDTIHLHHVLGFGADFLYALRTTLPSARLVLTLHEFIPICHRQGQMVRAQDDTLCLRATPRDCQACFPALDPIRFLRRERSLRALFSLVDHFIAPSVFLAGRYAEWGIPAERLAVIENALPPAHQPIHSQPSPRRDRFAFFGQLTPFKGVDLLLEAVSSLSAEAWGEATLLINGSGLERQPPWFQAKLRGMIEQAGCRVRFNGPYRNADVAGLMASADWVVVPSLWWENSPLVIQEARRAGRPVIASDAGGMREKVRHKVDGLRFGLGDAKALAAALQAARAPGTWNRLRRAITPPPAAADIAARHLALYRQPRPAPVGPVR